MLAGFIIFEGLSSSRSVSTIIDGFIFLTNIIIGCVQVASEAAPQ